MTRRTLRACISILVICALLFVVWDLLIYPASRDHGVASPGDATATALAAATAAPGTPAHTATPGSRGGLATQPARPARPARPTSADPPRATVMATPVRVPATPTSVTRLSPILSIRLGTPRPDAPVVVAGHGFSPGERVTLMLDGIPLPGLARAGVADGRFVATFMAPDGFPRGSGRVVAAGATSGVSATVVLRGVSPAAMSYVATASGAAVGAGRPAQLLLALSNPASHATHVRITLYFGAGATDSAVVLLRAGARRTVRLASVSNGSGAFGVALTAGSPIVARMLFARANARTTLPGTTRAGRTWYLTDDDTGLSVREAVALLNPDSRHAASVTLRLLVPPQSHGHAVRVRVRVPAHGEVAVDIGKVLRGRPAGVVVTATRPIAVARVLIVGHGGAPLLSGGSAALYRGWVFVVAGATGLFETSLSILNPTSRPFHVAVASYDRGSALVSRTVRTVTAFGSATVALTRVLRAHPHGVTSVVTGDAPIAVERIVYPGRSKAGRGKR